MSLVEIIQPEQGATEVALVELPTSNLKKSPRQLITRAVWNSVATFATVAQALRLTTPPQAVAAIAPPAASPATGRVVCHADLPMRARRSFAGVAIPRKNKV